MNVLEDMEMAAPSAGVEAPAVQPDPSARPRIAVLGLVVAGTAPLWILAPEGVEAVSFVAPFVAVPLIVAAALWRFGGRAWLAGVVAGLGLLAAAAPLAPGALAHPDSFFDFFPLASLLFGAALAVGGSVASALQRRRGLAPDGGSARWSPTERAVTVGSAVALLALGGVSGVLTVTGQHAVSALDRFAAEPVTMVGFEFEPDELTVPADREARFVVSNADLALHTFTVDELGVDVIVKPRSEGLVEFTPERPGVYLLYCRPHTQDGQGMVATLTVE
ncbi:MAG TPA: cupredoxin domain-containing protein [Egibacteraceae bacterium]|nr:cupredoxin domain-containing protein [Egibacteraceae bacterium]